MELDNFFQGGFSVAVAAFLLIRMEKELRLLREAIEGLRHCQTCTLSPHNKVKEDLSNVAIPG